MERGFDQIITKRSVWLLVHDTAADETIIGRDDEVAIRPSARARYDRLRKVLPEPDDCLRLVSPARRCVQTSARLFPGYKWEEAELLQPQFYGDWEGQTWEQVREDDPVTCEAFWNDYGLVKAPHGESLADVKERVDQFILSLSRRDDWKTAIIITYPEVVRSAVINTLNVALRDALRIGVEPLSISRLSHAWAGWQVEGLNHVVP